MNRNYETIKQNKTKSCTERWNKQTNIHTHTQQISTYTHTHMHECHDHTRVAPTCWATVRAMAPTPATTSVGCPCAARQTHHHRPSLPPARPPRRSCTGDQKVSYTRWLSQDTGSIIDHILGTRTYAVVCAESHASCIERLIQTNGNTISLIFMVVMRETNGDDQSSKITQNFTRLRFYSENRTCHALLPRRSNIFTRQRTVGWLRAPMMTWQVVLSGQICPR